MAIASGTSRLQLDDADVVVYKGSKTPRPCCRAVERACSSGCAWHLSPGMTPLEAILVIFGRRALIFFCLKGLGKK